MPKFVWEMTARGAYAPQLFHGELPREMTARENAHRYVIHELSDYDLYMATAGNTPGGLGALHYLAKQFPPPAPEPREITLRIETVTERTIVNVD